MSGLIDEAGRYQSSGVGVIQGYMINHMAPPADRVPAFMGNFFRWLAGNEIYP